MYRKGVAGAHFPKFSARNAFERVARAIWISASFALSPLLWTGRVMPVAYGAIQLIYFRISAGFSNPKQLPKSVLTSLRARFSRLESVSAIAPTLVLGWLSQNHSAQKIALRLFIVQYMKE
jgi:hypothetical protein